MAFPYPFQLALLSLVKTEEWKEGSCVFLNVTGLPGSGSLVQRWLLGTMISPPASCKKMVYILDQNLRVPTLHQALFTVLRMQR